MDDSYLRYVIQFHIIPPYGLEVRFDNGVTRRINLEPDLRGDLTAHPGSVFIPLLDPTIFAQAFLDGGTVAWPNGADLAPEALYENFEAL